MSSTLDYIIHSNGVTSTSSFVNGSTQEENLVTNDFSTLDNLLLIDKNDAQDTAITNPPTFSVGSNTLTINFNNTTDFGRTGVSDKAIHGRNKFIQFTTATGTSQTPIVFTRYTDPTDFIITYIDPSLGKIVYKTKTGNVYSGAGVDGIPIGNYNQSTNYTITCKIYENLFFTALTDTGNINSNLAGKVIRNFCFYDDLLTTKTAFKNGLGFSGSGTTTIGYKNLTCKNINNFVNVVCIGDSNTAGNWMDTATANPPGSNLYEQGNTYSQLLSARYMNSNIVFNNQGVSGDDTAFVIARLSNITACYVKGARNIATILLGTNDAGEVHNTWNFATTQSNFNTIFSTLKAKNFEVWVLIYPPRNQNPIASAFNANNVAPNQTLPSQGTMDTQNLRVSQINAFLRQASNVDLVIPLDKIFADPTATVGTYPNIYQNTKSTLIDRSNLRAGNGYIHFVEAGHQLIRDAISSALEKNWDNNLALNNPTISGGLSVYGSKKAIYSLTTGGDVTSTDGVINSGGQIVISGTNTGTTINNSLVFAKSGTAIPSITARSLGTRIILFPTLTASSTADFAIGMHSNGIWYGNSTTTNVHQFYGGATNLFSIGNGALSSVLPLQMNYVSSPFNATNGTAPTGTNGSINTNGQIICSGTNTSGIINNSLIFSTSGLGDPINSARSLGTRIIIYPTLTAGSTCDFAIGVNSGSYIWYGASGVNDGHKFFHNTAVSLFLTSTKFSLTKTSATISGTTATVNGFSGTIVTPSLSTAASSSSSTFTITNSSVDTTNASVFLSVKNYTGTGIPIPVITGTATVGSFQFFIRNLDTATALNNAVTVSFFVVSG